MWFKPKKPWFKPKKTFKPKKPSLNQKNLVILTFKKNIGFLQPYIEFCEMLHISMCLTRLNPSIVIRNDPFVLVKGNFCKEPPSLVAHTPKNKVTDLDLSPTTLSDPLGDRAQFIYPKGHSQPPALLPLNPFWRTKELQGPGLACTVLG